MGMEAWDTYRKPIVRDKVSTTTTTISASTAETTLVPAVSGEYHDVAMIVVANTSAATNTRIDFRDDTGGSVIFSLQSIGGAAPVGFSPPIPIPQTAKNKNWTAQCATSTTDVRIFVLYVKSA